MFQHLLLVKSWPILKENVGQHQRTILVPIPFPMCGQVLIQEKGNLSRFHLSCSVYTYQSKCLSTRQIRTTLKLNVQFKHICKIIMQLSLVFHWAIDTSIDEVYKLILWTHFQFETAGNYIKKEYNKPHNSSALWSYTSRNSYCECQWLCKNICMFIVPSWGNKHCLKWKLCVLTIPWEL